MVLKSCWIILLFQLIGYLALVVFEQGNDILRSLSFSDPGVLRHHSWASLIAVLWWSWQSWRSARVQIHFKSYDFAHFHSTYALRAQVLVPRLLGILPPLIFALGLVKSSHWGNPMIYINLCLAAWLYVFFHLRKDIIVYLHSRGWNKYLRFPDYVLIKNEAYPANFIWAKQSKWIIFRLACIAFIFALIVAYPVRFSQLIGSSALVLFALGSWLVIGTLLDYAEKHYKFPFTFTIILFLIGFSFFNNNHEIRSIDGPLPERLSITEHFDRWYASQDHRDTVQVVLVAVQGGGVRSSYWTSSVLQQLSAIPGFDSSVYAYSSVSGGTLGVATYQNMMKANMHRREGIVQEIFSKDFLSPVTSWLVVPDLIQKFLPFPIPALDRAKALEYSWEEAAKIDGADLLNGGFLEHTLNDLKLYLYHSTHAENGLTTLVSNAEVNPSIFHRKEDFFKAVERDVPITTAISVSSRFPFLTPPALVCKPNGELWGHLVDGGYVENMGASSMLELYDFLKSYSQEKKLKTKFKLLFIKNTKEEYSSPIKGMHELIAPLNTFSKVWINSGYYEEKSHELSKIALEDEVVFVSLDRKDNQLIPLGWFLSKEAIMHMENQIDQQTKLAKEKLKP